MTPYLPQKDPDPARRRQWIEANVGYYQFDQGYLPGMPLLKEQPQGLPDYENFSAQYIADRLKASAELAINMLAVPFTSFWDPFDSIHDYERYFPVLPRPGVIKSYETDASFAEQRLCGVNPLVIERITSGSLQPFFKSSVEEVRDAYGSALEVDRLLGDHNLYVCDYRLLDNIQGGTYERGRKYLPKPVALFAWISTGFSDRGNLVPIAVEIKIDRDKVDLYTPKNCTPDQWFFAKLCVQIADANHHEMSSHLCRTHFVMEPFAISTGQHLADNHPLGLLLRPHLRFMLANNLLGRKRLINRGGPVDDLLAGSLQESLQLVLDSYAEWDIKEYGFPADLRRRRMDDITALPHYPYRDDGQLLWDAISGYVGKYLSLYYQSATDLEDDEELQAWAESLAASDGGKLKGITLPVAALDDLVELVSIVIFTCGPLHSAINFAQYEYMAFTPNMPLAAYSKITTKDSDTTPSVKPGALLPILPPPKRAAEQLSSIFILSAYRFDRFGYYAFEDPAAQEVVEQFQQQLNVVERQIDINNTKRLFPYLYLKPSLVINSISI